MRLKRSRLRKYHHRAAVPKKDNEGNSYIAYGEPSAFLAEIWPAGGKLQAELYGQRLSYIRNCRIEGEISIDEKSRVSYVLNGLEIREGDGICVYVSADSEPDYRVIVIKPYKPLYLEMERI